MKKFWKVFVPISLLIIVISSVIFVMYLTNEKNYKITYNDVNVVNDNVILDFGKEYSFKIVPLVGETVGADSYSVKINPNVDNKDNDFEINVGGETVKFSEIGELTSYFDIEKKDGEFSLKLKHSLREMLELIFSGQEIENVPDLDKNASYFTCEIEIGQERLKFNFAINDQGIRVSLNYTQIIL